MKKTKLLTILLSCSLLTACGKTPEPTQQPTQQPTVEPTQQPTEVPTTEPTETPTEESTPEPTPTPTEEGFGGYEKLDSILSMERLEIGVNES